jgi:hypothetical protein
MDVKLRDFISAAIECSLYVSPGDPGLTHSELIEVAKRAGFFEGEVNDELASVIG